MYNADTMQTALIILLVVAIGVVLGGALIILKKLQEMKELSLASQNDKLIAQLNENLQGVQQMVHEDMRGMRSDVSTATRSLNERLDNAGKVIAKLQHELGGMKEIGRSISDFQVFLKSPKIRGNLGETILYDTLSQVFSQDNYARQYKFQDGQIVDAIIKTSDGIIPIDSKFPMESFQRFLEAETEKDETAAHREFVNAVRKHIRDIAKKYILPQEGTVSFAVMYVPSEAVYFEIVKQHQDLHAYADEQNILVVSPNIFSYFLKTVLIGIERARLNNQAQDVLAVLKGVQRETEKFGENLGVLAGHITRAKNAMDSVSGEYVKLSGKVDQVKLLK